MLMVFTSGVFFFSGRVVGRIGHQFKMAHFGAEDCHHHRELKVGSHSRAEHLEIF